MHIVYCIQSLHSPTGIERIVTAKANYLVSEYGYMVTMITTDMHGRQPAFALNPGINLYDLGIDYTDNVSRNPIKKLRTKQQKLKLHRQLLTEHLLKIKADVVISTFTEEMTFLPKIKDGSRKVLELHSCKKLKSLFQEIRLNHYPWWVYLSVCLDNWLCKHIYIPRYDRFVCLTKQDLDYWGGESVHRTFIYNMQAKLSDKKLALDQKVVISVGSLIKRKGFDRLIDIWQEIAKYYPDWELRIFGEGPERKALQAQIDKLNLTDKISLRGNSANIAQEYLSASVMAFTSHSEGFGMCLTEAKMCGLPCISYDIEFGPSEIINHGKDGFLVKDADSETFCTYLGKLMGNYDLRKQMSIAQIADSSRFLPETIMAQWNNLFLQVTTEN